jgi:hypothetical protein
MSADGDQDQRQNAQKLNQLQASLWAIRRTVLPSHLILRDDDLRRIRIVRPRYRVFQNTDRPNHLASLNHLQRSPSFQILTRTKVAGVTNHLFRPDRLPSTGHACKHTGSGIDIDGLDLLVEHVCPAVDCRETGEGLRELAETVEGVDVG